MERITVNQLIDRLRSEADAYEFLEELRWANGVECPHCGHGDAHYMEPRNGVSRATRTGAQSQRRVWRCHGCRRQFSVLTGTVMHGSKVPVRTWCFVIFEMCASKNGVAAREIERKYGVCARTAWFLMHRIREAMKDDGLAAFSGVVVADETYIGGSFKNMHKSKQKNYTAGRAGGPYDKTPVLTLVDTATGQARSRVLPRVDGSNLRKAIAEQVDMPNTILHTDKAASYNVVAREAAGHFTVDHKADEYVRREAHGIVTTNNCESFFSQLKRSVDGTHHHVSTEHLGRYLSEFDFRHNTRKMTDDQRMRVLVGQVGHRRLTYKRATA